MKINVDAGHGSHTAGKRTPPLPAGIDLDGDGVLDVLSGAQYREHYANVGVAVLLEEALKRCGFETHRTGWNDANAYDDNDTALTDRQKAIKAAGCGISVSCHFNAFGDGKSFNSAQGVETYIHSRDASVGDSLRLAQAVQRRLVQGTKQTDRGVQRGPWAMCSCPAMGVKAAILVELAFMTNEREAMELMCSRAFWKECAEEITQGVCDYTGAAYVPPEEEETIMTAEQFDQLMEDWLKRQREKEPQAWSAEDRAWAEETGVVRGDGTQMGYQGPVTKEQAVAMIRRALEACGQV